MANNSAASMRSALSTQLSAVSELQSVKSGRTQEFDGFPASRYYLNGVGQQQELTKCDLRSYEYTIDIIQPLIYDNVTVSELEEEFQDAVDAVLDRLGTYFTLGGSSDNAVITPSPVRLEEMSFGPANVLSINVSVSTLISYA